MRTCPLGGQSTYSGAQARQLNASLLGGLPKQNVDPIERYCAATDHGAGGNGAPEDVSPGKLPNCQQGSKHGDENAGARRPKRETLNSARVQVPALFSCLLRVVHRFHLAFTKSHEPIQDLAVVSWIASSLIVANDGEEWPTRQVFEVRFAIERQG